MKKKQVQTIAIVIAVALVGIGFWFTWQRVNPKPEPKLVFKDNITFKVGQKSFEEIKQCVTKEIQIQIINAILSHPKITKRTLTDSLPFEKNEILTQTKILSTTKQIQYDKKKKTWVMCSDSAYNNL